MEGTCDLLTLLFELDAQFVARRFTGDLLPLLCSALEAAVESPDVSYAARCAGDAVLRCIDAVGRRLPRAISGPDGRYAERLTCLLSPVVRKSTVDDGTGSLQETQRSKQLVLSIIRSFIQVEPDVVWMCLARDQARHHDTPAKREPLEYLPHFP